MKKKICLVTGGTGGHIYPALALAQVWKKESPDIDLVFIGNEDRMESELIPKQGYPFIGMKTSGLEISLMHKIKAVFQMMAAFWKARQILAEQQPDLVIGFGGYVCVPVLMAASMAGIPVMIHEQNSVVGKSNRLLKDRAAGIVTCYEKCEEVFDPEKIRLLGNPRATIAASSKGDLEYFRSLNLDPDKKTILIVMGSLGSSSVNELMKEALKDVDPSLQILYVAGKANSEDLHMFDGYENVHTVSFVDTLKIYPFLSGMVTRAGATTIAEVCAIGMPTVMIPSPYVANNHQYFNAKMLADQNAAYMIEEKDLNAASLKKAIDDVFLNEENRQEIARNAKRLGKPEAAQNMIAWADEIMAENASRVKK